MQTDKQTVIDVILQRFCPALHRSVCLVYCHVISWQRSAPIKKIAFVEPTRNAMQWQRFAPPKLCEKWMACLCLLIM